MTAYVEQLRRSEKRVNLIEGSLQIGRLLLSNDQAHRRGLASFIDPASDVLLLRIFHHDLLLAPCRHVAELVFSTMLSFNQSAGLRERLILFPDHLPQGINANSAGCIPDRPPERGRTSR